MTQTVYPRRERNELRFRKLEVLKSERAGQMFQRLTIGGSQLEGFVSQGFDDHIKVFFPTNPDSFVPPQAGEDGVIWGEGERPVARDYTPIYDAARNELTLDFYLHDGGVASQWAQKVQQGDPVFIGGPRGSLVVPVEYEWQLYVCDESGMPALRQRMQALRNAGFRGELTALVCTHGTDSRDYLAGTEGFDLEWFDIQQTEALTARLAQLLPIARQKKPFIWITGEGQWVKQIGAPFEDSDIDSRLLRMVAYWHAKPASAE